jgi:hypothetical protein
VQKLARLSALVLGSLLGVAIVALLGVNLYVQSQGTQTRIQQELSQRLGTPLLIQQISVTPWGGLKLNGIAIPQMAVGVAGNFLEAKTFRLRVRLLSLFSDHLVIKEVSLVDPHVIWPQDPDGKWRLPGDRQPENPPVEKEGTPQQEPSPEVAQTGEAAPKPTRETHEERRGKQFVPEVRRIRVKGGNFRFLDTSGKFVAAFEGLDLRSNIRNSVSLEGQVHVKKISLRDHFFLQKMQSQLRYDPGELDIAQMSAQTGGGELNGSFSMQSEAPDSPFKLAVKFQNVEAEQIVAEAGGEKGVVKGKLEGNFEAAGKITDPNALTGKGEIWLRDGQLRQYSVLAALGQILQIEELTQLNLEQASSKYHIDSGIVSIDELVLRSPNIRLSGKGTIGLDGKVRLESQLAINDKVRNQLFKPIRSNFRPATEPGYYAVDFEIGGTIDRPRSNLVDKVVGRDLKDLGSVINSFLGGGKGDRQKKKEAKTPNDTASPTEMPSQPPAAASPTP